MIVRIMAVVAILVATSDASVDPFSHWISSLELQVPSIMQFSDEQGTLSIGNLTCTHIQFGHINTTATSPSTVSVGVDVLSFECTTS